MAAPGAPNGGDVATMGDDERVRDEQGRALRHGEGIGVTPATSVAASGAGQELVWPGGPTTWRPQSYGPVGTGGHGGPLFDYEQLRRFQELYDSAPGVYGVTTDEQVARPDVLREEEELQRRLAELQELKRQARQEQEQRFAKMQQEKKVAETREGVPMDQDKLRQMIQENLRLKEEIRALRKGPELNEKRSPLAEEFNTPEDKEETTATEGVARRLDLGQAGGDDPLRAGLQGGDQRLHGEGRGGEPAGDTMKFMMTMLESMQQLIKERTTSRDSPRQEVVKSSIELPKLAEWAYETGPIDLGDWVAQALHPLWKIFLMVLRSGGTKCGRRPTIGTSSTRR